MADEIFDAACFRMPTHSIKSLANFGSSQEVINLTDPFFLGNVENTQKRVY